MRPPNRATEENSNDNDNDNNNNDYKYSRLIRQKPSKCERVQLKPNNKTQITSAGLT